MNSSRIQQRMQLTNTQTQAWESWKQQSHQSRIEVLSKAAKLLRYPLVSWLMAQLESMEETIELPGPTGEANSLSWEGRGLVAICYETSASNAAIAAQLFTALACGNLVILQSHLSNAEQFRNILIQSGLPESLIELTEAGVAELAKSEAVTLYAYSGSESSAIQLDQLLAERGGALPQLVYESDYDRFSTISQQDYPWRFVTESTLSVNTTAVGGNATLLELGGKSEA